MSEIAAAITLCKPFTDELEKLGFEYRIQIRRKGDDPKYMDLKTDGFKEKKLPKED